MRPFVKVQWDQQLSSDSIISHLNDPFLPSFSSHVLWAAVTVLTLKLIGFPFQVLPQAISMKLPDMGHKSFQTSRRCNQMGVKQFQYFKMGTTKLSNYQYQTQIQEKLQLGSIDLHHPPNSKSGFHDPNHDLRIAPRSWSLL